MSYTRSATLGETFSPQYWQMPQSASNEQKKRLKLIIGTSTETKTVHDSLTTATIRSSHALLSNFIQIHALRTKALLAPLSVIVEADGDGFLAQTVDFPLYGFGDSQQEAISMLQSELESLYDELVKDDNFSEEWLNRKKLLFAIVA